MLATCWFFCLFDASLLFATDTVVLYWNEKIPSSIEVLLVLECRGSMVMFLFGLLFRLVQAIVVSDRTIYFVSRLYKNYARSFSCCCVLLVL